MFTQNHRVSLIYLVSLGGAMLVMTVINVVLFQRLLFSDIVRGFNKKEKEKVSNCADGKVTEQISNNNLHKNSIMVKLKNS